MDRLMRPLDRIRREWSERKTRFDTAHAAVDAFTPKEREEFCAELCARVESEFLSSLPGTETETGPAAHPVVEVAAFEAASAESETAASSETDDAESEASSVVLESEAIEPPESETKGARPEAESVIVSLGDEVPGHLNPNSPQKTDRAEAFVWEKFSGTYAFIVGDRIKQDERTAESTLRQVQRTRGTIVRRRGQWFPAPKQMWKPRKTPLHEAIVTVLSNGQPLGTAGIVHAVRKIRPDASYGSVASEIMRLRKQNKVSVVSGSKWSGRGSLYTVVTPPMLTGVAASTTSDRASQGDALPAANVFPNGVAHARDDALATDVSPNGSVLEQDDCPATDVVLNGGARTLHVS